MIEVLIDDQIDIGNVLILFSCIEIESKMIKDPGYNKLKIPK